jgi:hypothetical protein
MKPTHEACLELFYGHITPFPAVCHSWADCCGKCGEWCMWVTWFMRVTWCSIVLFPAPLARQGTGVVNDQSAYMGMY